MFNFSISPPTAGTKNEQIKEWKVFFQTPFGLAETLDAAVQVCSERNADPNLTIVPVSVAVTETSYEVVIR